MLAGDYKRRYAIFRQVDSGYGTEGRNPSGHMRMEVREGRGKLTSFFSNLAKKEGTIYRLYLVNSRGGGEVYDAGSDVPEGGSMNIECKFDPSVKYEAAVLTAAETGGERPACPLAVCFDEEVDWRHYLCPAPEKAEKQEKPQETQKPQEPEEESSDKNEIPEETEDEYEEAKDAEDAAESEETEDRPEGDEELRAGQNEEDEKQPLKPDLGRLKEMLDSNFQKVDPFRSRRSDYNWWRVESPVHLKNLLFRCNIKTPLLFSANVMEAHNRYRYMIAGIFTDRKRSKRYLVCGIPGSYRVDASPFGDMCRWVQAGGHLPRYGCKGYWLVYVEPDTGNILTLK